MSGFIDRLKNDKKTTLYLIMLVAIGVVLIFFSNNLKPKLAVVSETNKTSQTTEANPNVKEDDYESNLEKRLSVILSQIDGVGKTQVMITLSNGREIVIAEDKDSSTDAEKTQTSSKTVLIRQSDGTDSPLVIKQIEPKIEGVIIVAEGGGNESIREKLTTAAQALLKIETYKVQIYKMK